MYIVDDVCYAGELVAGIKVETVKPLRGRMMLVKFSTGETRLLDTNKLRGAVFAALDDEEIFMSPTVKEGVITWAKGTIDIAPEAVYEASYAYEDYQLRKT